MQKLSQELQNSAWATSMVELMDKIIRERDEITKPHLRINTLDDAIRLRDAFRCYSYSQRELDKAINFTGKKPNGKK